MLSSLAQADPGWGTDWEYRMLIEITDNSGSTLTDYQVPILIDTATFNYSKARPDGGDIRFGTTSGIDCDYWIEEWNATSESTIWVKVPSIPTSGTTSIYMYYGNASVTSTSNKNNTMNFFETGSLVSAGTIDEVGVYNISLTKSYDNPAVVAHVATRGGGQSIDVRARNVGSSSFEIFEEEPDDEAHNDETLNWIVAESGSWIGMDGQLRIEAGAHSTSSVHVGGNAFGGDSVSFDNSFNSTPSVLATINTYNNGAFMSTHTHGLTNTSFVVQQEAAETGKSASTETIGWIAFSGDAGTNDGINYEIGYHSQDGDTDGVDNTAESISYSFAGNPCLVVQGSTTGGSDGYWTRGAGTFSSTSANFYAEEDQVGDTERSHADEGFSWAAFYPQGSVVTVRKYASTEPTVNLGQEETTTSWTDYFGGTAAISASTNVDVSNGNVELGHIATEQIPFSDSFEIDLSNWDDNYATSWYIATNRFHDGSQSVRANNNNEGYLISDDIDLSDATSATIDFWFNKDDTEGQDFTLYFYDGSNWNLISELDGLGGDDVWLNYDDMSIDISTYGTSDFRIRFDATLGWGENVWVDQLTITKTTEQYSNAGSITSVSITPSNLQSWGTFSALDNNPTFCLNYSKTISITGTGTALTDYQVNIPVTYTSCMNADFSDLRFKDSSGTILSYWIESYVASTSAQVWVKVPSITASGTTTIYMYYGNAAASSASNGEDTFIFFDDFSGDLSKWTKHVNGANINIVSCYLECGGGTTATPYGHTVLGSSASYNGFTNGIIDGKVFLATDGIAEVGYRGSYAADTGYKSRMDARAGQGLGHLIPPYSGWAFITTGGGPSGTAVPTGTWYPFSIIAIGSSLNISCAGQTLTGTDTSYTGPGEISLQNHYGTYSRFDDIRVRKYASTMPALSIGSEESGSYCGFTNPGTATSIIYKVLNAADDSVLCTITAAQAATGYSIASCADTIGAIKLRATLTTTDTNYTPTLHDWSVTWSQVTTTIDITAPSDITGWTLDPTISENTINGTLSVNVSPNDASWSATARDLDITTNGFMTEWNGSSYGAVKLTNSMRVEGPAAEVTLPNAAEMAIAAGTGDYPSITITFKQDVTWDDDPNTYRIVVTFVGTVN